MAYLGNAPFDEPTNETQGQGMSEEVRNIFERAWEALSGFFSIGDGRREADIIVPVQNQVGDRLAAIVRDAQMADSRQLDSFYWELYAIKDGFERFTNDSRFTDGRASRQAQAGILPLIAQIQADILEQMQSRGGSLQEPRWAQPPVWTFPWEEPRMPPYQGGSIIPGSGSSFLIPALLIGGAAFAASKLFRKGR